ncbi:hypothetical protein [Verrucomicrobium spinosum]|nr:hypothetical protein [Verrucomicrobium spinosum]
MLLLGMLAFAVKRRR